MALTRTRKVQRIEIYPGEEPSIMVVYEHTFDDTEDADLPAVTTKVKHLSKMQQTLGEDGAVGSALTDVSGEDLLVQTVANAIWN